MYRRYCQVAAFVFAAYTVYPVVTKLIEDRLAHDWAHSALHLVSALVAAYAGWLGPPVVARLYVVGIGVVYGVLGVYGWFIDGLFLDSHYLAVPLGPVENIFHLALAIPAVTIVAIGALQRRRSTQASHA
jgi:hypothetical protein